MLILLKPGDAAPVSGTYEEVCPRGTSTGVRVTVDQGDALPDLTEGCRWRLVRV